MPIDRRLARLVPIALAALVSLTGCGHNPMLAKPAKNGASFTEKGRKSTRTTQVRLEERLGEYIARYREHHDIPGVSVALVDLQAGTWSRGFGLADREKGRAATEETVYRAGSLAKLYTATAVLQLAAEGRIDLDRPVRDYLPGFQVRQRFSGTAPITVRDLVTHHSGLPCDLTKGMWSRTPYMSALAELDEVYASYPPGEIFSYSNLGYTLLGRLVESVEGRPYQVHVRESLLEPLGAQHSRFATTAEEVPGLAAGYRDGLRGDPLPMRDLPALGLHTSARDLAGLLRMLLTRGDTPQGDVLPDAAVQAMFAPQNADVPLDFDLRVGLGLFLDDTGLAAAGTVARHSGTTPLFAAEVVLLPDHDMAVAVLANRGDRQHAVGRLAEEILRQALTARRGLQMPVPQRRPLLQRADALPPEIGGRYATELGLIELRPHERTVKALTLEHDYDLIPYEDGHFVLRPRGGPGREMLLAYRRIDGREVLAAYQDGRALPFGLKVGRKPIHRAWRTRVGEYQLTNPDARFPVEGVCLRHDDGNLYLEYRMPSVTTRTIRVPVRAVSSDLAVTLGLGRTRGEALHITHAGGQELLHFSGYTARRVN
ncbi:MAG TPA: serine hydrolase domain-containing protein [Gammaproteobacteria bacterium]|nr:serine hydrolase domain-containing protein [Gammaproteobacteria bacterium]